MKILLLGANGQVGRALRDTLAPLGTLVPATRDGVLAPAHPAGHARGDRPPHAGAAGAPVRCEIADFDAPDTLPALIARIGPDVVVNAAAYTAVDRAESEPDAAFRANAQAPARIAQACVALGARLVHYSTDYVFDGVGTRPCREDDATAPLGVYGHSKLAGEDAVRASGVVHTILRTAWVYDGHGHNFLRTMLRLAAERDELRVVADQTGTPTSSALIAGVTASLLAADAPAATRASATWHLTADGHTTWHGFAQAIVSGALARGLIARAPRVVPIATADYPTPARRPAWSVLDCGKLRAATGQALPPWRAGLDRVLDDLLAERAR